MSLCEILSGFQFQPQNHPALLQTLPFKACAFQRGIEIRRAAHVFTVFGTITPENNDPDIQYFDDVEGDVLYPDPELTFKTKLADLPLIVQEMIFSNKIDDNGVLIRTANDKPGYFAVGFMSEKANGTYRYVWLFKVRAKPVTETYATKEGTSITRQTGEVEWTAIKRTSDGRYQAVADEGENGFTAEKAAAFLNTVYTPVFTAVGS